MPDFYSIAEEIVPERSSLRKKFALRLFVTLLISVLDVAALVVVSRIAIPGTLHSVSMQVLFAVLALGLGASLGRMWFLTVDLLNFSRSMMYAPVVLHGRPLTRGR
jgi:hypothetical protein